MFRLPLIVLFICFSFSAMASFDLLSQMNVMALFDLKTVHKKYEPLMVSLGCAQNVFGKDYIPGPEVAALTQEEQAQQFTAYCRELKNRHNQYRYKAVFRPVETTIMSALFGTVSLGVVYCFTGFESAGMGLTLAAAATSVSALLSTCCESSYNYMRLIPNEIDVLEDRFLRDMIYIPQEMWPEIMMKFRQARESDWDRRGNLSYLKFALSLTQYRPIQGTLAEFDAMEVMAALSEKIDAFFEDYEGVNPHEMACLKSNILQFLYRLKHKKVDIRYTYFSGAGGLGKTHFVAQLASWINELLPNSVHYQLERMREKSDLEGDSNKPGIFLNVIRKQLQLHKHASIVFMDEADWIANGGAEIKNVFNGKFTRVSTRFFGEPTVAGEVEITLPPMLILVACNEEIKDANLRTRFDCFHFPNPTYKALAAYAVSCLEQHPLVVENKGKFFGRKKKLKSEFKQFLDAGLKGVDSFRMVESRLPALAYRWVFGNYTQESENDEGGPVVSAQDLAINHGPLESKE